MFIKVNQDRRGHYNNSLPTPQIESVNPFICADTASVVNVALLRILPIETSESVAIGLACSDDIFRDY